MLRLLTCKIVLIKQWTGIVLMKVFNWCLHFDRNLIQIFCQKLLLLIRRLFFELLIKFRCQKGFFSIWFIWNMMRNNPEIFAFGTRKPKTLPVLCVIKQKPHKSIEILVFPSHCNARDTNSNRNVRLCVFCLDFLIIFRNVSDYHGDLRK